MFVYCPSSFMVSNDPGQPGASVNWTVPVVEDNAQVTFFASSHQPLDNFTLATTEVTYLASDAAGNNNTCSFTITVIGKTAPVHVCPDRTLPWLWVISGV